MKTLTIEALYSDNSLVSWVDESKQRNLLTVPLIELKILTKKLLNFVGDEFEITDTQLYEISLIYKCSLIKLGRKI